MEVNGRSGGEGATEEEQHRSAAVIEERLDPIIRILKQQCEYEVLSHPRPDDGQVYCNATFDGWGCWNYTLAGTVATIPCPQFFYNDNASAVKECEKNGTWRHHAESGKPYSNYTMCAGNEPEEQCI